jgi:NAD(P)-dependent dehydrogenase (short-subunit alcohol dehydrogenase family)
MRGVLSTFSLAGRVAAITGGARGLGLSMARALREAGARVALVDLDGAASPLHAQLPARARDGRRLIGSGTGQKPKRGGPPTR